MGGWPTDQMPAKEQYANYTQHKNGENFPGTVNHTSFLHGSQLSSDLFRQRPPLVTARATPSNSKGVRANLCRRHLIHMRNSAIFTHEFNERLFCRELFLVSTGVSFYRQMPWLLTYMHASVNYNAGPCVGVSAVISADTRACTIVALIN